MATLSSLLNRIPAVTRTRYGGNNFAIWVDWANEIIEELEQIGLGPDFRKIIAYPRMSLNGVSFKPESLVNVGSISDADGERIDFSIAGENGFVVSPIEATEDLSKKSISISIADIKVDYPTSSIPLSYNGRKYLPIYKDPVDSSSTILGSYIFIYNSERDDIDKLVEGWKIDATLYDTANGNKWVCVAVGADVTIPTDGKFAIEIYDNAVYISGSRRINRLTSVNSEVHLPEKYYKTLLTGLRYKAEIQTDETSGNSRYWALEYDRAKKLATATGSKHRGEVYGVKPATRMFL